ncbi:MAG: hypothetical protein AAF658_07420 [Myxococcota bacterium]
MNELGALPPEPTQLLSAVGRHLRRSSAGGFNLGVRDLDEAQGLIDDGMDGPTTLLSVVHLLKLAAFLDRSGGNAGDAIRTFLVTPALERLKGLAQADRELRERSRAAVSELERQQAAARRGNPTLEGLSAPPSGGIGLRKPRS